MNEFDYDYIPVIGNFNMHQDCYLWRYRNRDNTFVKWSKISIKQNSPKCDNPHSYVKGSIPTWESSTSLAQQPNEINVNQNHFYYMWSKYNFDIVDINDKFKQFVILNYEDLINQCEKNIEATKSINKKSTLKRRIKLYKNCIDLAKERFDRRNNGLPYFDHVYEL